MSETALPLDQQLEEIRVQLAWVRDYLTPMRSLNA